jgi:hypothetical protein
VKVTNQLNNRFTLNAGVRQGDGLSLPPCSFYPYSMESRRVIREAQCSQICAYADDIVTVARTQKKLTEVYLVLEDETSNLGMEINEKKTT